MAKFPLALLAAAAALTPASALAQSADSVVPVVPGATRLDLSVIGTTTRVPDLAIISAGVQTQAKTAGEAIRENANRMKRVVAALKQAGIADRDIQTSNINLSPQYDYRREDGQGPILTGYTASNNVSVRFRDIAKSGEIVDALVSVGANQINGPQLTLDNPQEAMDEARLDALEKGRARADLYARALGKRVTRLAMVSEGASMNRPQPIVVTAARMEAADASTEIIPGEQDVNIVLSMSFDIQ